MNLSRTPRILSDAASLFFGISNRGMAMNNAILEATLRYIAIKSNKGDLEKTEFMAVDFYSSANGSFNLADFENGDCTIYIARPSKDRDISVTSAAGWVSLDKPPYPTALFLSQISATSVYVNNEHKKVFVVVKNPTERWISAFCSTLFRVLTWLYPADETPSQEEIALFRALGKEDGEEFINIVDSCCANADFESAKTKKLLFGWLSRGRADQIANMERERTELESTIRSLENDLATQYRNLEITIKNLSAWLTSPEGDNLAVFNFFNAHKQLTALKVNKSGSKSYLYFSILETLEYYDENALDNIFKNETSLLYTNATGKTRRIIKEIFINRRGVFRVESVFILENVARLTPNRNNVSGLYSNISLPHPHLYYHACLGGNSQYIQQYLKKGDWDLAIEQAIAATKNINFNDYTVFREFLGDVDCETSKKCIVLPDGKELTINEFYDMICTEDEANKTSEENA